MQTVTEKSTAYLTVSFYDKSGTLQLPVSVTYRIDDIGSGLAVREDTPVSPASSVEIKLSSADNVILNANNKSEQRRVTVIATYGLADQVADEFRYEVVSLVKVS